MKVKIAKKITDSLILSKTINLDITGATLLSIEEAETFMTQEQRAFGGRHWWWLRSPGCEQENVAVVHSNGSIYPDGDHVAYIINCIRPALNFKSSNLKAGNKFEIGKYTFTILSNSLAICDSFIDESVFRKDRDAKDANDYEKSDIKIFVDNWFNNLKELYDEN